MATQHLRPVSKSFEDLEVWQKSKHLCVEVCKKFKASADRAFRDQVTRAALSIPSNIAEGAERTPKPEFRQFLGYAKGSAGEVRTQIIVAVDLGYLTIEEGQILRRQLETISRMLFGLIRSMKE
jgi:S23 ribosomal protein.